MVKADQANTNCFHYSTPSTTTSPSPLRGRLTRADWRLTGGGGVLIVASRSSLTVIQSCSQTTSAPSQLSGQFFIPPARASQGQLQLRLIELYQQEAERQINLLFLKTQLDGFLHCSPLSGSKVKSLTALWWGKLGVNANFYRIF